MRRVLPYKELSEIEKKGSEILLKNPQFSLSEGFIFAYKTFLQSIADGEDDFLNTMCESNLAEGLLEESASLREDGYTFSILNNQYNDLTIEVMGMTQVLGAHIDRRKNKGYKKLSIGSFFS